MKQSLLDVVQVVLSSLDSEEVNSIGDTVEANQVALICKNVFYDMMNDVALPEKQTLFQLEASIDPDQPVLMTLPSQIVKLEGVRYNYTDTDNTLPDYREIQFVTWSEWMLRQTPVENDTTYGTMTIEKDGLTFQFWYKNDEDPSYYTTFDDYTLLFNSYDVSKDTTLKKHKTMCVGRSLPLFLMQDTYIPDMDATEFPRYINKCKVRAFNELKQTANEEAAAEARRQKIMTQKRKLRTEDVPAVYSHARFGRNGTFGPLGSIPRPLRSGS